MRADSPSNRGGAPTRNLNAARTLAYARDIEGRVDGRSLLGQGLASHRDALLSLFNVASYDGLNSLEVEAVRRLVKRRVVRELAWGRLVVAYEQQDVEAYNAEVERFQRAVDAEERTESRLQILVEGHGPSKVPTLQEYLAARAAEASERESKVNP